MKAVGAAILLGLLPVAAIAETDGSSSMGQTVDPSRVLPSTQPQSTPIAPPETAPIPTAPPAPTLFTLSDVRFDGAAAVSGDRLQAAWADYRGKPVSLTDLRIIARRAEAIYKEAGYPFVAIVAPPQNVSDGVVHLTVVEGHISGITVLSKNPTARRQAQAAFGPLIGKTPLSAADVDAAYQLAKDVPGLAVSGALRRGDEPGGMDLVIQAQRDHWNAYVNVNDLYPDATGPWGVLAGLDYYGDSLWGDVTSGQFYSSVDGVSQYVLRLSHVRRLNSHGTTLSAMTLFAWADPKGVVAPLDIAANVQDGRIAIAQPLIDRSTFKLVTEGAFEVDDQATKIFKTTSLSEDRLQVLSASLTGTWRPSFGGFATLGVEARKGVNIVNASRAGDPNLSRFGADPQAFVGQLHFTGETAPVFFVSLAGRVEGQIADHALTAPDEYAIGNLAIGRGYEPGAAFGDEAIAAAGEVRFGPIRVGQRAQLQPYAFYDAARLWMRTPGAPTTQDIASYGGGVRFDVPNIAHVDLAWAQPTRPAVIGGPVPKGRLLLNITIGLNQAYAALSGHGTKGGGQ